MIIGAHIDTLLLRFFLMYMPELIKAGKVYRAVPPLFGISDRGGKTKYFTTKLDFTKYVQNLFAHIHTLADTSGRRLTSSETTNLFFKNIDYKDQLDFIANTFAVDPDLLESVLYCLADYITIGDSNVIANMAAKAVATAAAKKKTTTKNTTSTKSSKTTTNKKKEETPKTEKESTTSKKASTSKASTKKDEDDDTGVDMSMEDIPITEGSVSASIAYFLKPTFNQKILFNELKKLYRFINVVNENGVLRIEGLVNSKYQYVFINDKFISACIPLLNMIKNNTDLYYLIDGNKVTLYQLMSEFDNTIPSGLTRYKGLGEQSPDQLGISALRPDGDRTLIRYTIESAKEEIEALRRIDNSMASLLRDVKITKADNE